MRWQIAISTLLIVFSAAKGTLGAEYKGAIVKSIGDKLLVTLTVEGKEVKVTAFPFMKGFDDNGQELKEIGHGVRVLKQGNVVDIKTESMKLTGKAQMYISEGRLIKGDLQDLEVLRKLSEKEAKKPGDQEWPTYTVVKAEPKRPVKLRSDKGKEISVIDSLDKAFTADGAELPADQIHSVLKEGNLVAVKLKKSNRDQLLKEVRLVRGELGDAKPALSSPSATEPAEFARYKSAVLKAFGFKGSTIEVEGKEIQIGAGNPMSRFFDDKGQPVTSGPAMVATFKPGTIVDVVLWPPPKRGDGKPVLKELRIVKPAE